VHKVSLNRAFSSNFAAVKQKMNIICLRTVRYSDSRSILTAYSLEGGRVAFVVNSGSGREALRRRALTQPLALVECVADVRAGSDIHRIAELRALTPLASLRSNPLKGAVALFIAEVLGALLRESQPDEAAWHFIERSIMALDLLEMPKVANFHLWFLWGIGGCLGVSPDVRAYSPGNVFDMSDGIFRGSAPLHGEFVPAGESATVALLGRMSLDNLHLFRFTLQERNAVLDGILRYLSIHITPLGSLKSLDVLRSLH
jgi:DNA repair protein RecO (recombination protein O)